MSLIRQAPAEPAADWSGRETESLQRGLDFLEVAASASQVSQLETYARLLLKWNRTYNLLGATTAQGVIEGHLLDSIASLPALLQWLPSKGPGQDRMLVDVGSGAGLPGVALAIMLPDLATLLVEPIGKKAAFLRQVIAHCRLSHVRVLEQRIEQFNPAASMDREVVIPYTGVIPHFICRAFTSLARFAVLCRPHMQPGSRLFAMKAARVQEELADLGEQ